MATYAVAPSSTVRRVLRELDDDDRTALIDSLRRELTGRVGFNTAHITDHVLGGHYWLTATSSGWQVAYRWLQDKELTEFGNTNGVPEPDEGFFIADLQPIDPLGPLSGLFPSA